MQIDTPYDLKLQQRKSQNFRRSWFLSRFSASAHMQEVEETIIGSETEHEFCLSKLDGHHTAQTTWNWSIELVRFGL